jgi:hypothetical protein
VLLFVVGASTAVASSLAAPASTSAAVGQPRRVQTEVATGAAVLFLPADAAGSPPRTPFGPALPPRAPFGPAPLPLDPGVPPWLQLRGRHAGQECLLIGNGPSLNKLDWSFLEAAQIPVVLGLNKIYLGFEV